MGHPAGCSVHCCNVRSQAFNTPRNNWRARRQLLSIAVVLYQSTECRRRLSVPRSHLLSGQMHRQIKYYPFESPLHSEMFAKHLTCCAIVSSALLDDNETKASWYALVISNLCLLGNSGHTCNIWVTTIAWDITEYPCSCISICSCIHTKSIVCPFIYPWIYIPLQHKFSVMHISLHLLTSLVPNSA